MVGISTKKLNSNKPSPKDYNFKKYKLTADEKLWLTEILKFNFDKIDARSVKVNLVDKLSSNFDSSKLNGWLTRDNRLTLLGLWYLDPANQLFQKTHQVIEQIKHIINIEPKLTQIESKVIASILNLSQIDVQFVFTFIWDLGFCNGGTFVNDLKILEKIQFNPDQNAFDKILYYKNIDETLETFFNDNKPKVSSYSPTPPPIPVKAKSTSSLNQIVWKQIVEEFKTNQIAFGKKINFVKDPYTRRIIFRDVEVAYTLYKKGFSKAAILLAGGVIEELLRIYLTEKKGHVI